MTLNITIENIPDGKMADCWDMNLAMFLAAYKVVITPTNHIVLNHDKIMETSPARAAMMSSLMAAAITLHCAPEIK